MDVENLFDSKNGREIQYGHYGDFSGNNMDNESKFSEKWRNEILIEVKTIGKRIKNRAVENLKRNSGSKNRVYITGEKIEFF